MLSSLATIAAKLIALFAILIVLLLCFARRDGWSRVLLVCLVMASQAGRLFGRRRAA